MPLGKMQRGSRRTFAVPAATHAKIPLSIKETGGFSKMGARLSCLLLYIDGPVAIGGNI